MQFFAGEAASSTTFNNALSATSAHSTSLQAAEVTPLADMQPDMSHSAHNDVFFAYCWLD